MGLIAFTEKDILHNTDEAYFERGKALLKQGKVVYCIVEDDGSEITGSVEGSARQPYRQYVTISDDPWFEGQLEIDGDCTCPVGHNCKHVVALLLSAMDQHTRSELALPSQAQKARPQNPTLDLFGPADSDPAPLMNWKRWKQEIQTQQQRQQFRETLNQRESPSQILYELKFNDHLATPTVSISPYSARILKKGGFGTLKRESVDTLLDRILPVEQDRLLGLLSYLKNMSGVPVLQHEEGALSIERLLRSGYLFTDPKQPRFIKQGLPVSLSLQWHETDTTAHLNLHAPELPANWKLIPTMPPYYFSPETHELGMIVTDVSPEALTAIKAMPPVPTVAIAEGMKILRNIVPEPALPKPESYSVLPLPEQPQASLIMKSVAIPDDNRSLSAASLIFHYGPVSIGPEDIFADEFVETEIIEQNGKTYELKRDFHAEESLLEQLFEWPWHIFTDLEVEPVLTFLGKTSVLESVRLWDDFIHNGIPKLKNLGWQIEVEDSFSLQIDDLDHLKWETDEDSNDWFSLGLNIDVDGQSVPLLPLLVSYLESSLHHEQSDEPALIQVAQGRYLRVPSDLLNPLSSLLEEWFDSESQNLQVSKYAVHALLDHDIPWQANSRIKSLATGLSKGPSSLKPPKSLQAGLRPYQQTGFEWLQHLRKLDVNGILADDMGLGKTLQTLAHVLKEKEAKRLTQPALVVAPTSLVGNWRAEAEKFAPKLKTLVLHGPDRHAYFDEVAEADLVITTYPLIVRDEEFLSQFEFHLLILDEAQVIKNPKAKAAQVVRNLNARHRLCLTGTPLENHLGELWALFDFLMPGFLRGQKKFNEVYRYAIEKRADSEKQKQLNQRITPFMLRRTKQEVVKELPPKTEIIQRVQLEKNQATLYETVRASMEKRVRDLMKAKGLNRSHIEMLDALLKLRQVCCDPQLVKLDKAKKVKQSAKLDTLMDMLPEQVEEGRKILLFSQFTEMLSLIEARLNKAKIPFVKLTGQTRKRQEVIDAFQNGDVPVFLISLKAGGVGLNLTAADTVIHYDPWWNPAAENQATDRAHRIGQDKPVFVYKLICENTVEEKILALQQQKQALADAVYDADKEAAKMSTEQWMALFQNDDVSV